jgi:hypothetical protein
MNNEWDNERLEEVIHTLDRCLVKLYNSYPEICIKINEVV